LTAFVDLHVLPKVDDENSSRRLAELIRLAGYSAIGLTVPTGLMHDKIASLRRLFEDESIETFLRVDIVSGSRGELLRLLRRFRSGFDILGVKCVNQGVASVACRDRRVDVVFFDPNQRNIRFSHAYANLLRGALELNLISSLLGTTSSETFSKLAKEAGISRSHNTRVILSSGSRSPETVRSPLQVSAIGMAIGLSREQSLRGVSQNPESIVRRNKERRSATYIEEGVRLVAAKAG
jgi:RNase P/RNase MRP subunit p30